MPSLGVSRPRTHLPAPPDADEYPALQDPHPRGPQTGHACDTPWGHAHLPHSRLYHGHRQRLEQVDLPAVRASTVERAEVPHHRPVEPRHTPANETRQRRQN